MSRIMELVALVILLVLQASAADCVEGTCAADSDAMSLVQVMQVTKPRSSKAYQHPTHSMHRPDDRQHYDVDLLSERKDKPKADEKVHNKKRPDKEQMDSKVDLIQSAMDEAYRRHRRNITEAVGDAVAGGLAKTPNVEEAEERRRMRYLKAKNRMLSQRNRIRWRELQGIKKKIGMERKSGVERETAMERLMQSMGRKTAMERRKMQEMQQKMAMEQRTDQSMGRKTAMERRKMQEMQQKMAMEQRTMAMERRQRNMAMQKQRPAEPSHQHYHGKYGGVEDLPQVVDWTAEAETMPGNPGGKAEQAYEHSFQNVKNEQEKRYAEDLRHVAGNTRRLINMQEHIEHGIGKETDDLLKTVKAKQDQIYRTEMQKHHAEQAGYHEVAQARRKMVESALKKMQTERAALEGEMEGHTAAMQRAAGETDGVMNSIEMHLLAKKHEEEERAANLDHKMKRTALDMDAAQKEAEGRRYMNKFKDTVKAMKDHAAAYAGITENKIVGPEGVDTRILKNEAEQKSAAYKREAYENQRIIDKTASGRWNAHLG